MNEKKPEAKKRVRRIRTPRNGSASQSAAAEELYTFSKSAKRAQFAGIFSLALLLIFLIPMIITYGREISFANMYNFVREVNLSGQIGEGERTEISYALPTRNQGFAEFKRGFIVASDREVQVFNKAGFSTLLEQTDYSDPKIATSENTFLVYDLGGRGFTLYNSFEDIYLESREYPISAADMASDGRFAVVGKSAKYNTEVTFYDCDGKREFAYMRSDYTIDCKYSLGGRSLALLSLDASDGEFVYTLSVLDAASGESKAHITRSGMPYNCYYLDGDKIAVVLSDSVIVYNNSCEKIGEYEFPDGVLYRVAVSEKNIALMFTVDKVNMKNKVYILGTDGDVKKEYEIDGVFSDMKMSARHLYFASENEVLRLDISSMKLQSHKLSVADSRLVILDSTRVLLCGRNMAHVISVWS